MSEFPLYDFFDCDKHGPYSRRSGSAVTGCPVCNADRAADLRADVRAPEGVSGPEQGAAVERLAKALEPFAAMGDNPNLLPNGNECDLRCGVPSPRQLREASAALAAYRAALRSAPPKETT